MMMVDDVRGEGGQNMMMSSLFLKLANKNLSKIANLRDLLYWKINQLIDKNHNQMFKNCTSKNTLKVILRGGSKFEK